MKRIREKIDRIFGTKTNKVFLERPWPNEENTANVSGVVDWTKGHGIIFNMGDMVRIRCSARDCEHSSPNGAPCILKEIYITAEGSCSRYKGRERKARC
jgi:hypothetical protein